MNTVRRFIQHIAVRGCGFHDFNICLLLNAADLGLACIVGGNAGKQLAVGINVKGGVGERCPLILVNFNNRQTNIPDVLKSQHHIFFTCPFHGFDFGRFLITLRGALLGYPVRAIGQLCAAELNNAVKAGCAGGGKAAVNLLKAEHCTR